MSQDANINTKLEKLQKQIDWFYSEEFDLSKAADKYESATKLATDIEQDLDRLKNRIEIIAKDFTVS